MAVTGYAVNDPLAVKLWAKKLIVEALKATWFTRFVGTTASSLVQRKDDLSKSAGDKITFGLRMQLVGGGVQGDAVLEGEEESLTTYSDAVIIDQQRHAVRTKGRMSQQRVSFSVREEALSGLTDWWSDRMDLAFFNQIAGNVAATDTRYTGNNAAIAPDAQHYMNIQGGVDDTTLGSGNKMTLSVIDSIVERFRTITPAVRPLKIDGKEYYVGFLHPYQVTDMRTASATVGSWFDIQSKSLQGNGSADNPIFSGALGVYNGVILHEDARVPVGYNPSGSVPILTTRRAVFCGAQAAALAYGQENGEGKYKWVESKFDYDNQLGVSAAAIWGLKKTVFNSKDFATMVVSSYAIAH